MTRDLSHPSPSHGLSNELPYREDTPQTIGRYNSPTDLTITPTTALSTEEECDAAVDIEKASESDARSEDEEGGLKSWTVVFGA